MARSTWPCSASGTPVRPHLGPPGKGCTFVWLDALDVLLAALGVGREAVAFIEDQMNDAQSGMPGRPRARATRPQQAAGAPPENGESLAASEPETPPRPQEAHTSVMSESLSMTEARARLGSLVRRASHARERITITDHGQPAAVLINPQELADLEDALALAQYRQRQAAGQTADVPHAQVRARLGPEQASCPTPSCGTSRPSTPLPASSPTAPRACGS